MNKLLKALTVIVLIGCLNNSVHAYSSRLAAMQSQSIPQKSCDSIVSFGPGFAPVPGQPNTYQAAEGSRSCGGPIFPTGWVLQLPAGAKLFGSNGKPISPIIRSAPVAAPVAVTTPVSNAASVQWMTSIYYRYAGPNGMIYVNDNDGTSYLQQPNGTKTNLPPVPRGQYLMRPTEYQLPGWLLAKWAQNPSDNGEYFVAAGNGNSSSRIISKGPDGALQVRYTTQNQWTGRDGVVHQVTPVSSTTVNSQPAAAKLVAPSAVPPK